MLLGNLINTRLYSIDGQLDAFLSINNPAIPRGKPNGNCPWNEANSFPYRLCGGMDKDVIRLFKNRYSANFLNVIEIHIKLLAHQW